jgi:hypothetical protein
MMFVVTISACKMWKLHIVINCFLILFNDTLDLLLNSLHGIE